MSEVEFSSPEEGLGEEWVDEVVVKCKGSTDNLLGCRAVSLFTHCITFGDVFNLLKSPFPHL